MTGWNRRQALRMIGLAGVCGSAGCLRLTSDSGPSATEQTESTPESTEPSSNSDITQGFESNESTWQTYMETRSDDLYIDQSTTRKTKSGNQACVFVNGDTSERFVGGIETPTSELQDQTVSFWVDREVIQNDSRYHSISVNFFVPSNSSYSLQENPSFDIVLKRENTDGGFNIRFKEEENDEIYQEEFSPTFTLDQNTWYRIVCDVRTNGEIRANIYDGTGTTVQTLSRELNSFTVPTKGHTRVHRWSGRRPSTRLWIDDITIERI